MTRYQPGHWPWPVFMRRCLLRQREQGTGPAWAACGRVHVAIGLEDSGEKMSVEALIPVEQRSWTAFMGRGMGWRFGWGASGGNL
jgi:hypothetical protein